MKMLQRLMLRVILHGVRIESNIGDIRRSLMIPCDGSWNSAVREVTAEIEWSQKRSE